MVDRQRRVSDLMPEVYALDLDEELLSHLPIEDSWITLQGEEFNPVLIKDEFVREVYDFQLRHRREQGAIATATVICDEFDLDLRDPETSIGDLIDRLRLRYMKTEGREALRIIVKETKDGDPMLVPQKLLAKGRELAHLLSSKGEVFGTGDYDRAIHRYDYKASQGPGASFGYEELDKHFNGMRGLAFLLGYKKTGKALALDTPIPTPSGWIPMGSLRVGDQVFDEQGNPCHVVGVSPIWNDRPCRRVTFDDRTSIIADVEHEWLTQTRVPQKTSIRTTQEIQDSLLYTQGHNHSVKLAGPLQCNEASLPIDPYVLGAWLGDGTSADAAITTADEEIVQQIQDAGYTISKWPSATYVYGILGGFRTSLRTHGLLNCKHIPSAYLRGSISQRMALLQGLMDTDGSCEIKGGCSFTSTNEVLVLSVLELIRSLGFKPSIKEGRAKINGVDCGAKWTIRFHASHRIPVFRLTRKLIRQGAFYEHRMAPRSQTRKIVAVDWTESVPVRCITVDSPSHLFLAGEGMIPTHNSWQMIQSLLTNVEQGHYPWLYSLELPAEETDMRFRCLLADVPWWKWVYNKIGPEDRKALKEASELIDGLGMYKVVKPPHGQRGIDRMVHTARDAGAGVVLIDQLQYVENDRGKSLGRLNDTGEYFGVLDEARNLSDEGPLYIAHQFGRGAMGAESMPDIALAKGSSAIEEVCTLCLGLWSNKDMRRSGLLEIGTLMARNTDDWASWEIKIESKRANRFEIQRRIEEE